MTEQLWCVQERRRKRWVVNLETIHKLKAGAIYLWENACISRWRDYRFVHKLGEIRAVKCKVVVND